MGFAKYAEDNYEIWMDRMDNRYSKETAYITDYSIRRTNSYYEECDSILNVYEQKYDTIQFNMSVC